MTIGKDSCEIIATFLPDAMRHALSSYEEFSRTEVPKDAKGFSAHHTACKVAIAHIELLIKLAERVVAETEGTGNPDKIENLKAMMAQAQSEVDKSPIQFNEEEDDLGSEGDDKANEDENGDDA